MKAIILAAGIGSRLRPITNSKPKTMVKVNGTPMIGGIIISLKNAGINEIIVCTGYKSDSITQYLEKTFSKDIDFTFVHNSEYLSTNNMYSLYLARNHMDEDIIIMNADLVYDSQIMLDLVNHVGNAVAVDKDRYLEESMKITVNKGFISSISKKVKESDAYGCSIDIYKFDKSSTDILKLEITQIIEQEKDLNQWTEVLLDKVFSSEKIKSKPMDIKKMPWYEIDNFEDLAAAEILFNKKLDTIKNRNCFILDKDGTLTIGSKAIDGASDFIDSLSLLGKKWIVASNNSSKTSLETAEDMMSILQCQSNITVISSLDVAVWALKSKGYNRIYSVATDSVIKFLSNSFTQDETQPEAVLLTYDTQINYSKILKLISLIKKGIPYYATHIDTVCPTENGDIPDIGSFIQLISNCTGLKPIQTFGKPNKVFIEYTLNELKSIESDAVVIGDRLYTDIAACENSDITSVLVLSGETSRDAYENSEHVADIILPSIASLKKYI